LILKLKYTKKINLEDILFIIFLGIIVIGGIFNIIANKTYTEDSFTIGEWLINYQGGFVRRGFSGHIIYFLSSIFKISPIYLVWFVSVVSYIFLINESLKIAKDKVSNLFLLSPIIFLAPLVGNFLIRKDILILLLFLINLKILKKDNPNLILMQTINILGTLIHEVFAIFSFPIQIFIFWKKIKSKRKNFITFANFLIPIFTFCLCLIFKGDNNQAIDIHNSWVNKSFLFPYENLNNQLPMGAINAISFDIKHVIDLLKDSLTDFKGIIWVPFAWFMTIILVSGIFLGDNSSKDSNLKSFILFFQFLPFTLLCFSGWDYGRWIFIWILSSVLIYCSFKDELKDLELDNRILKYFNFLPLSISSIELKNYSKILLGLFVYPHCCWSLYYLPSLLIFIIYSILKSKKILT
tara:strand:- start:1437 stop:2663 length:1227 start_codon:yes stop_codon:yes gene_type:complete